MNTKKLLCGMMVALSTGPVFGAISYEDVTRVDQGAIAYYNFNESAGPVAADAVGSNDGAYGSGVTVNQSTAPRPLTYGGFASTNTSALLDASSSTSRVVLPTAINMNSAAGSVSMWINTSAAQLSDTDAAGLFYGTSDVGGDGFGTQNELHLDIRKDTGQLQLFARGGTNADVRTPGDADLDDSQWHHVAATWNQSAGQMSLYIDGSKVASSSSLAFNNFNFSTDVRLGEIGPAGNHLLRQYGGHMDEVAVYNTALTDQQITDQYHAAVYHYTAADFVYTADANGRLVGEGEIFMNRADSGANGWRVVPDESAGAGTIINARGDAYVQSLPDNGSGGSPTNPPSIEYKIQIDTPGVYRLYTRWEGNATTSGTAGSSDSLFVNIAEITGNAAGTDWYEMTQTPDGNFATSAWDGTGEAEVNAAGAASNPITFNFTTAGEYTLRFSQREDGSAVDAWVLQPQALAAPAGAGPLMSSLQIEVEAENYTRRGDNGSGQAWLLVDASVASGNLGDGEHIGAGGKFANAQNNHYMQILDDNGTIYNSNATADDGPYLDFDIVAPTSGFYQLSLRFDGADGAADSLYARILELQDGLGGSNADWYRFVENGNASFSGWLGTAGFEKTDAGGGDVTARWYLLGGQTYTLRFQPREDGVALDAFRLTLLVPEPTAAVSMIGLLAALAPRRRR